MCAAWSWAPANAHPVVAAYALNTEAAGGAGLPSHRGVIDGGTARADALPPQDA